MAKKFLDIVREKARRKPARIIFPETSDKRILRAAAKIIKEKTARPILVGNPEKLKKTFGRLKIKTDFAKLKFIDMEGDAGLRQKYAKRLYELRKDKGMTPEEAKKCMNDPNYFGVMAVKMGDADGMLSGSVSPTASVLHPALQIIRTKKRFHKVSGFFFMTLKNRLLLFADCAVNIEPDSHALAEIAIDTAETAKRFGINPRIALLSFSTNGSTKHPNADRVREAVKMVRYKRPELICEGEMQVDAALSPDICRLKFPDSRVPGNANVLIFPNLESANISYKLLERLGHAEAIGPVIQGLQKPINDLSRGCSADDIVHLAAITSVETQETPIRVGRIKGLK